MNRTAGSEHRTKKTRSSRREAPLAILRKWRRSSPLRNIPGETSTLSFLVCRMRGFEELIASRAKDPAELCRLVRRGAKVMADALHAHGGIIDRAFPGGCSAYFDATRETGNPVLRACECAHAMLAEADARNRREDNPPLHIGIGLSTGPAILGDFGTEDQPLYAAVGRAAQKADALERLSAAYGTAILASHAVERDAERSFAFLPVDHCVEEDETLPIWAMLASPLSRGHPKFLALKSFHAHIFDALRGRRWNEARNLVGQCRALSGANMVLYDFYLQRIAYYEANPPPSDWNGVLMPAQS